MSQTLEDQAIEEQAATNAAGMATTRRDLLHTTMFLSAAAIAAPFATGCARAANQTTTANNQSRQPGQAVGKIAL